MQDWPLGSVISTAGAALKAARLEQLAQTTLAPGEKLADLLSDRSAYEDFDVEAPRPAEWRSSSSPLDRLLGA